MFRDLHASIQVLYIRSASWHRVRDLQGRVPGREETLELPNQPIDLGPKLTQAQLGNEKGLNDF